MKILNRDLFPLFQSMRRLDGVKLAAADAGKTRYALAKNLRIVREAVDDLQMVRVQMIQDMDLRITKDEQGNEIVDVTSEAGKNFARQWDKLVKSEIELPLFRISFASLKVDESSISFSIIDGLLPILIDAPDLEAETVAARH